MLDSCCDTQHSSAVHLECRHLLFSEIKSCQMSCVLYIFICAHVAMHASQTQGALQQSGSKFTSQIPLGSGEIRHAALCPTRTVVQPMQVEERREAESVRRATKAVKNGLMSPHSQLVKVSDQHTTMWGEYVTAVDVHHYSHHASRSVGAQQGIMESQTGSVSHMSRSGSHTYTWALHMYYCTQHAHRNITRPNMQMSEAGVRDRTARRSTMLAVHQASKRVTVHLLKTI
jgi:hypothetical protein